MSVLNFNPVPDNEDEVPITITFITKYFCKMDLYNIDHNNIRISLNIVHCWTWITLSLLSYITSVDGWSRLS
jgi:hypothetical protein